MSSFRPAIKSNSIIPKTIFLVFSIVVIVFILSRYHFFDELIAKYNKHIVATLSDDIKDRVWAHRVNSREKAKEAAAIFKGIEIDVVFDVESSTFDVNHPPAKSIGLSLKGLLDTTTEYNIFYWVDWKNPTRANVDSALSRLTKVAETLHIDRNKIIVECQYPDMLKKFTRAGFNTSFYLPKKYLDEIAKSEEVILTQEQLSVLEKHKLALEQGEFNYISCHSKFLPFIQNIIPENKRILLWNHQREIINYFDRRKIIKTLQLDERIDALLVKLDSKHDR